MRDAAHVAAVVPGAGAVGVDLRPDRLGAGIVTAPRVRGRREGTQGQDEE
jgi:hypothetical protein